MNKIVYKNGKLKLLLDEETKNKINELLEDLGLEIRETKNLWGLNKSCKFYRENDKELYNKLHNALTKIRFYDDYEIDYIDDINRYGIYIDGKVITINLAIFRIIDNDIEIEINKLLNVIEYNVIVYVISKILEEMLNLVENNETEILVIINDK
jgi:nitrogenase molybdenum-iron protein alpha/beta subunit